MFKTENMYTSSVWRLNALIVLCLAGFSFHSCKKLSSVDNPPSTVSIYQVISEDSYNFSFFKYIVDRAGQAGLLNSGNYTAFVPQNSAFLASGYTTASMQLIPVDSLIMIVRNHIVEGRLEKSQLTNGQQLKSLNGETIQVNKIGNDVYVDGANITNPNENVSNGIVHVVNKLMAGRKSILDRLNNYTISATNSQFSFLTAAIARASQGSTDYISMLSDVNANLTFFAPNNGAFIDGGYATIAAVSAAVPDTLGKLLKRHLLSTRLLVPEFDSSKVQTSLGGVSVYFDRTKPSKTTYAYANGIGFTGGSANMLGGKAVVHSISRFIPVPVNQTTLARIQSDTSLSFFNAALTKASQAGEFDFVKMLSDAAASYTVFAVNNSGFRSAGYKTINDINSEKLSVLSSLLKFHILSKRISNINISENGTAPTLLSYVNNEVSTPSSLTFTLNGGFKVKGASNVATVPVISGNIVTTNGLLNIIGSILLP